MEESKSFLQIYNELDQIGQAIRSGELKVEKINLFLDLRIDLEKMLSNLETISNEFYTKEKAEGLDVLWSELHSPLSYFLESSTNSFLAPAYHLNNYLEHLNEYNVRSLNKENLEDVDTLIVKFNIEIQSIFSSIKGLLDRLVAIMSFFYSGFSLETTFGRIDPVTGKTSGLMGTVFKMKEQCPVLKYINDEYHLWIRDIVVPRDIIIHYNDLGFRPHYTADGRMIPFHIEKKVFEQVDYIESFPIEYNYKDIVRSVTNTYLFVQQVLNGLIKKDFRLSKKHFIHESSYKQYRGIQD
ncbi:hypothetical protein JYA63_17345 [Fictibacillus nanhaiensis]|uniref:LXG domain-containing protein n=1 Tax=Fictibacillus nanhaiensis TaxID=742169 RepID=A0ABS2ZUI1_9BACL|nr:hypothetical protein [Fictibacillus nanhaiensis]